MSGVLRTGLILVISALFVVAVACGDDAPPDAEFAQRIEVFAPVDEAEVITVRDPEIGYQLRIVSGLPNSCAEYLDTRVNILGNKINVNAWNTIPEDVRVVCAAVYGSHERTVELRGLAPSIEYELVLNNADPLMLMTEAEVDDGTRSVLATIIDLELEMTNTSPPEYDLIVTSELESSCISQGELVEARTDGRIWGNVIRVSLTNIVETNPAVECSGEITNYEARVAMPGKFVTDGAYELQMNGRELFDFVGGLTELKPQPPR
jgi:hypothetical protein